MYTNNYVHTISCRQYFCTTLYKRCRLIASDNFWHICVASLTNATVQVPKLMREVADYKTRTISKAIGLAIVLSRV